MADASNREQLQRKRRKLSRAFPRSAQSSSHAPAAPTALRRCVRQISAAVPKSRLVGYLGAVFHDDPHHAGTTLVAIGSWKFCATSKRCNKLKRCNTSGNALALSLSPYSHSLARSPSFSLTDSHPTLYSRSVTLLLIRSHSHPISHSLALCQVKWQFLAARLS